jgi:hypothetical protein
MLSTGYVIIIFCNKYATDTQTKALSWNFLTEIVMRFFFTKNIFTMSRIPSLFPTRNYIENAKLGYPNYGEMLHFAIFVRAYTKDPHELLQKVQWKNAVAKYEFF